MAGFDGGDGMAQTVTMKAASAADEERRGRLRAPGALAALLIFLGSAATIAGAWFFQLVIKLPPCPLCLEERIPYYVVVPLSLLVMIGALARVPRKLRVAGFAVIALAMLCGAALGIYHAGVEWRFWPGPTDCTGPITDLRAGGALINQLQSINVVRCDEAAWRFLGISLAGYNALICLVLAAIAGGAMAARTARR